MLIPMLGRAVQGCCLAERGVWSGALLDNHWAHPVWLSSPQGLAQTSTNPEILRRQSQEWAIGPHLLPGNRRCRQKHRRRRSPPDVLEIPWVNAQKALRKMPFKFYVLLSFGHFFFLPKEFLKNWTKRKTLGQLIFLFRSSDHGYAIYFLNETSALSSQSILLLLSIHFSFCCVELLNIVCDRP